MKFSSAVDALSKENEFLKKSVMLLGFSTCLLAIVVAVLYEKEPIVVERSSRGLEIVRATKLARTDADIKEAIRLMLVSRFDSSSVSPGVFLSNKQMLLREEEQKEMKARGISQGAVVRSVAVTKDSVVAEFDRVLAVGDIRSALKTTVRAEFEEAEPTELNPYGLKLSAISVIGKEEKR